MTPEIIEDMVCSYEGCGMPVEVYDVRGFPSSDCSGHTLVVFFRCAVNHTWPDPDILSVGEMFA